MTSMGSRPPMPPNWDYDIQCMSAIPSIALRPVRAYIPEPKPTTFDAVWQQTWIGMGAFALSVALLAYYFMQ